MRPRLDRPHRLFRPRCLILGMVLAWIAALYLPLILIAAAGPSGITASWAMADAVSIPAKLGFALIFAALILASRRFPLGPQARVAADAVLGALAMLLLLAFLPQAWSRGFGIGLTGARFDAVATFCYLAGGLAAGLVFTLADAKCGELRPAPAEQAD